MSDDEVYGDQYELATFMRRVLSVADAPLRRRQVERHFTTVDAAVVAEHVQGVLTAAVRGDDDAKEMLFPIAQFIHSATEPESMSLEAIDLAARAKDLHGVAWLLLDPPPAREIDARAMQKMMTRGQSLGHRRSAASGPDQRALDQLTRDEHPMVIERLCANPRVLESHIMTIVTRRPTLPALLETVASSPRWFRRVSVREGLVNNPYGPTGLALRTLPTLGLSHWKALRHAGQVHDAVRAFATYLCNLVGEDGRGPSPESLTPTLH